MKRMFKLGVLALAAVGARDLYRQYGGQVEQRVRQVLDTMSTSRGTGGSAGEQGASMPSSTASTAPTEQDVLTRADALTGATPPVFTDVDEPVMAPGPTL